MSLPSLVFTVERSTPELIPPAKPTPYEFKLLSDIDDQKGLRKHSKAIMFYKNVVGMEGRDPVKVIRDAIAKALVYYYPFAGRVLDGPNGKLMVECTGSGVLFIEANADVRLEQFGDVLRPPFLGAEDLLYDVPGSAGILHCPLLLIQVTRLICGGFTFAFRNNHTMADASGMVQFMKAVGEIACGADIPSVKPVWKRELLNARKPPQVSCLHRIYLELQNYKVMASDEVNQFAHRSFFFSLQQITNLKNHLPSDLQKCSNFEILTANLWICRTVALGLKSDDEVRLAFPINARSRLNPPLPVGFYGNALAYTVAQTTSGILCQMSLGNVLMLVKTAINDVTDKFIRSSADFLVQYGRSIFKFERTFFVSDLTRMGFKDIDFGWGKPIYGGPILGGPPSFFVSSKNNKGEDGIAVTLYLPQTNMDRLAIEIDKVFGLPDDTKSSTYIVSPL